jgi:hypothetical protein
MNIYSGLDVHKGNVFACIIDGKREKIFEKRYGTLTPELKEIEKDLFEYGVKSVAMESTSIYSSCWLCRIVSPKRRNG